MPALQVPPDALLSVINQLLMLMLFCPAPKEEKNEEPGVVIL